MNIKDYIGGIEKKLSSLETFSKPLKIAAFDVTARMGERIFDEGKKEYGSAIGGKYSETPIYVNPDKLTVKKNIGAKQGKNGDRIFKSGEKKGQPHKTKYLAGGYEELRDKTGRQTNYVDLNFSGELRLDFSNGQRIAQPRKINALEYQIRLDKEINQKKRLGMDEKYGTIFKTSKEENALFFETIGREFRKILSTNK
ncbi:MAG: hypothetical protein ACHQ1D_00165 [Nitrososphaerales archaeon]